MKRIVFLFLFVTSAVYSMLVYTTGTHGATCDAAAARGKLLFQQFNCTSCHQLFGLGGYLGPDLTHAMSTPGKGEPWCRALLENGSGRMPDFRLSENQTHDLLAYLAYIDSAAGPSKQK